MKYILPAIIATITVLFATSVQAAPATVRKANTNVETHITADKMTYFADQQRVIFENNVHVDRPDFEIWSVRLTIYLKAPEQGKTGKEKSTLPAGMSAGNVDKIIAEQNVRMKSENRTGTCTKATYTVDNGVLIMEGDPHLTDGENTISGEIIRYFTEENSSEVQGGAQKRVEAVFSSPNKPATVKGGR